MEFPPAIHACNPTIDTSALHPDCSGYRNVAFGFSRNIDGPASVVAAEAVAYSCYGRIAQQLRSENGYPIYIRWFGNGEAMLLKTHDTSTVGPKSTFVSACYLRTTPFGAGGGVLRPALIFGVHPYLFGHTARRPSSPSVTRDGQWMLFHTALKVIKYLSRGWVSSLSLVYRD
jgi:hypothetical protein